METQSCVPSLSKINGEVDLALRKEANEEKVFGYPSALLVKYLDNIKITFCPPTIVECLYFNSQNRKVLAKETFSKEEKQKINILKVMKTKGIWNGKMKESVLIAFAGILHLILFLYPYYLALTHFFLGQFYPIFLSVLLIPAVDSNSHNFSVRCKIFSFWHEFLGTHKCFETDIRIVNGLAFWPFREVNIL